MTTTTRHSFTLTWTLDASPAEVFRAWTDPSELDWFYNDAQPTPSSPIEVDLRVGGAWRQEMVISAETRYVTGGVYREIVPDEKLVFSWGAVGGWPELDPDRLDDSPLVTLVFERSGERTQLVLQFDAPGSFADRVGPEMFARIQQGWPDTVDRLASRLNAAGV